MLHPQPYSANYRPICKGHIRVGSGAGRILSPPPRVASRCPPHEPCGDLATVPPLPFRRGEGRGEGSVFTERFRGAKRVKGTGRSLPACGERIPCGAQRQNIEDIPEVYQRYTRDLPEVHRKLSMPSPELHRSCALNPGSPLLGSPLHAGQRHGGDPHSPGYRYCQRPYNGPCPPVIPSWRPSPRYTDHAIGAPKPRKVTRS
jgi:hypothetical protein